MDVYVDIYLCVCVCYIIACVCVLMVSIDGENPMVIPLR